jgi:hypothetical protein
VTEPSWAGSWWSWFKSPWAISSDLHRDVAALRVIAQSHTEKLNHITREITTMGAREDAAYQQLSADIQTVKDGWAALVAERDALKEALQNADANAAAQVQAALDTDSDIDAAKVEAADAALASLVAPAPGADTDPNA